MTTAALCEGLALREDGSLVESSGDVLLRTLLREHFAELDAASRKRHIEQIAAAAEGVNAAQPVALRKSLLQIREALRERLPACDEVREQSRSLRVDGLIRLDARSFYVHGFVFDEECATTSLKLLAPDGTTIDLLDRAFRHPHIEADGFYTSTYHRRESGFIAFVTMKAEQLDDGWIVTTENAEGAGLEARCPPAVRDRTAARQKILSHLRFDHEEALVRQHVHPAMALVQDRRAVVHEDVQIGQPVAEVTMSIVVPLFARVDLIEHQLAAMAGDADVKRAEIIFVLDSPELADDLRGKLKQLQFQYHLPLRMVVVSENCGFAGAVNLGVSLARGAEAVILHSDVFPSARGWLAEIARAKREAGAVAAGALLLYQDESVQHAAYRVSVDGGADEPMKGLHRELIDAARPQVVEAISAACMLVDRDAFVAADGMSGAFVDGQFEDVDLCRRLIARGGAIAWTPRARLYHLEGQSTPAKERDLSKPYNAWLARERWKFAKPLAAGA